VPSACPAARAGHHKVRYRDEAGRSAGGPPPRSPKFDTALTGGLDPVADGTLEAQLTGRDYDAITTGPRSGHMVASADGGQPFVIALTDELKDALASADQNQLRSAAGPWSQTEEFFGQGNPAILTRSLRELADLACRANASNRRLYCWVCAKTQNYDILVFDAPKPEPLVACLKFARACEGSTESDPSRVTWLKAIFSCRVRLRLTCDTGASLDERHSRGASGAECGRAEIRCRSGASISLIPCARRPGV